LVYGFHGFQFFKDKELDKRIHSMPYDELKKDKVKIKEVIHAENHEFIHVRGSWQILLTAISFLLLIISVITIVNSLFWTANILFILSGISFGIAYYLKIKVSKAWGFDYITDGMCDACSSSDEEKQKNKPAA